jgi:hypothetical protein
VRHELEAEGSGGGGLEEVLSFHDEGGLVDILLS